MKESEAWRYAAEMAEGRLTGLCYGLSRLVRDGKLTEEQHDRMTGIILSVGRRLKGPSYRIDVDYIWRPGDPERQTWAEEQARLAELEEAREEARDASEVSDLPGRDEGTGDAGELPVVPVPALRSGELRDAGPYVGTGAGDAAGAAGGGAVSDLNRNVPAKPVRRYKVTGTYEATFEIEVEANDEDDAVEKAKEGVEAGNHEVTDTGEIKVDDVEEVYGSSPRCPNCDQALDLEEY